jgi:uncharacterized protein YjbI with pentapeptide repeats
MEDSRFRGAFFILPKRIVMDTEKSLFTEQSYEDRHFASLACQDAERKDIEFFQCRFDGCQFLRTTFRQCRFEECVFEKCDLSLLKVPESSFIGVRFLHAKMLGIDWTQAATPLTLAFQGSNIGHSTFVRLSLQRMAMVECVAREVDFTGTNLTRANLGGTDCRAALTIDILAALENRHFEESKIRNVGFLTTISSPGALRCRTNSRCLRSNLS